MYLISPKALDKFWFSLLSCSPGCLKPEKKSDTMSFLDIKRT